jgi:TolB-like protein/Flp pilus assembly protein TadD
MLSSYRLIRQIGAGGMGEVWKAVDTRLDREVALKVVSSIATGAGDRLRRFEREAKAVAALNHPHIVTIFSVEHAGDVNFITMELVEGKTLAEVIPGHGLALGRFFDLAVPLADALHAAHDRGVVHRDLKPANIMITKDGRLKILDFGLAKLREEVEEDDKACIEPHTETMLTQAGQVMGTVPYMSPEQVQGKPVDHRTDIFSLGIIFYEMATGNRPFTGGSSAELISSILRDAPPPVSESNVEFPDPLSRIVRRCLDKDPGRRYQSARDLRNELEDLKQEVATGAPSKGIARPRRRIHPVIALPALAVVTALVGLGMWLIPGRAERTGQYAIAVLPFANLTGDSGKDYMSQGISAGLITQLSEVSGVRVAGRAATWGQKIGEISPRQLAERLSVNSLLEGEVQQVAGRFRIDVKLTDPASSLILWSDSIEGGSEDLFSLQAEIARRLAAVLSVRLSSKELQRLGKNPTASFKAYDDFLRGSQQAERVGDPQSLGSAIALFQEAIRLDPGFALAHAGLSDALWWSYRIDKSPETLTEARHEAERALDLDPDLPAAQVALARIHRSTGRNADAIAGLQRVLANHPKPDEAYRELADSYQRAGDMGEAEKCFRMATTLGAKDWSNWNALGDHLLQAGRYDEAREAFEKGAAVAPKEIGYPLENLVSVTILQGRFEGAIKAFERLPLPLREPLRDPILAGNIGTAYYFSDRPDKWKKAEEYYKLAARLNPRNAISRSNLADLYHEIGRRDEAIENYREAQRLIEEELKIDPASDPLRLSRALYAAKAEDCPTANAVAAGLESGLPKTAQNVHRLAYVYGMCGDAEAALKAIATAIDLGVAREIVRREPEFEKLRKHPKFLELTAAR